MEEGKVFQLPVALGNGDEQGAERSKKEVATCCKQSVQMSQESMGEREGELKAVSTFLFRLKTTFSFSTLYHLLECCFHLLINTPSDTVSLTLSLFTNCHSVFYTTPRCVFLHLFLRTHCVQVECELLLAHRVVVSDPNDDVQKKVHEKGFCMTSCHRKSGVEGTEVMMTCN